MDDVKHAIQTGEDIKKDGTPRMLRTKYIKPCILTICGYVIFSITLIRFQHFLGSQWNDECSIISVLLGGWYASLLASFSFGSKQDDDKSKELQTQLLLHISSMRHYIDSLELGICNADLQVDQNGNTSVSIEIKISANDRYQWESFSDEILHKRISEWIYTATIILQDMKFIESELKKCVLLYSTSLDKYQECTVEQNVLCRCKECIRLLEQFIAVISTIGISNDFKKTICGLLNGLLKYRDWFKNFNINDRRIIIP